MISTHIWSHHKSNSNLMIVFFCNIILKIYEDEIDYVIQSYGKALQCP